MANSSVPYTIPRLPGPACGLRIGLMGGSFDPPHAGHAHVLAAARRALHLDWVWVFPSPGNPLKHTQTPFEERLADTDTLLSGPRVRVSRFENDLGTRYSVDLIAALRVRAPTARFVWVMGADNLSTFHHWRAWQAIAQSLPICVVSRPGASPKAGLSRFARRFSDARLPESDAAVLAWLKPPAWVLITARHNPLSSTALRISAGEPQLARGQ